MRATGEHTAAVPIPDPPPPPSAVDAEKERRRHRRPARRPKQAAPPVVAAPQGPAHVDATEPRSCRSMPPMHVCVRLNAEADAYAAGTSRSCPLLPMPCPMEAPVTGMGGGAVRRFYQPHWPEQAVEEAVKVVSGAPGEECDSDPHQSKGMI